MGTKDLEPKHEKHSKTQMHCPRTYVHTVCTTITNCSQPADVIVVARSYNFRQLVLSNVLYS